MGIAIRSHLIKERRRQRIALLIAVIISALILLGMYLIKIRFWEYQSAFEYGQEISFGTDAQGSGNQPVPLEDIINTEDKSSQDTPQEESIENEPDVETSPNSETRLPQKEEESKKPQEPNSQPKQDESKPNKVQDDKGKDNNQGQGNDNKDGVKGKENGINKDGLYDGQGGRGGSSLSLSGWDWEEAPKVNDATGLEGRIMFAIIADEEGFVISAKEMKGTTVTDRNLIEKYRQAVLNTVLVPKGGANPSGVSRGTVTFILTAK